MPMTHRTRKALPAKASEPFLTQILVMLVQLIQYLLRLFFNSEMVITET
jgi:hypothetical protein